MEYIHVKNLENYQPGYTDRRHIWAKIYYDSFLDEKLQALCEIDKYRFWSLIVYEVFHQKPIPLTDTNLKIMGWEPRKRRIPLTLQMLHTLVEVRNVESEKTVTQSRVDKSRVDKNKYMSIFEEARKIYPGTKRGLEAEFENFVLRSKHPKKGTPPFNFVEILPLLKPAIESQIRGRRKASSTEFVPPWKNFETWINKQCWGEEGQTVDRPETPEEKIKREKAEAIALEKRKQELRNEYSPFYKGQTTEKLNEWLTDKYHITQRWIIKEILEERKRK